MERRLEEALNVWSDEIPGRDTGASTCKCVPVQKRGSASGGGSGRGRGRGSGGADSVHTKEGLQSPVSSLQLALALALAGLRNCL